MSMNTIGGAADQRLKRPGNCFPRPEQHGPHQHGPHQHGPHSTRPGSEGNPKGFKPGEGPGPGNGPVAAGGRVEGGESTGGLHRGGCFEIPKDGGYKPSMERLGPQGISGNVGALLQSLQQG